MSALTLALMTALSVGFCSCSNGDDDEEPQTTEISGVAFTVNVESTEDELAIGNVTIEYLDGNGKEQTENITEKDWSKTIIYNKFPAKVSYTLKHSMKDGIELEKEKYTLGMSITQTCHVIFSDNTTKPSAEAYFIGKSFSDRTTKDYVAQVFSKKGGVVFSPTYTIKKSASGEDVVYE